LLRIHKLDHSCSVIQRKEEFDFFQPELSAGHENPAGDVITIERDIIYRNVDAFCERVKDSVVTKELDVARGNLHLVTTFPDEVYNILIQKLCFKTFASLLSAT